MKATVESPDISHHAPLAGRPSCLGQTWPRLTPERQAFDRWINSSGGAAALQAKINVCLISW
jgi:hypothetical protein